MNWISFIFFSISFLASIIGAICGIGGGVIMKPVMDAFHILSVSTISFLSGCTVLAMSSYSVIKGKLSGDSVIDMKLGTPIAIGASLGGLAGKIMFETVAAQFADKEMVGAVQASVLLAVTLLTFVYTIKKAGIRTLRLRNPVVCAIIGLVLGIFSSFLGIGGGPINLMILSYCFSMQTKEAAQNSLYIIVFSQITSLLKTILTNSVPEFGILMLILMVAGGILGGICGRRFNKNLSSQAVDKLFLISMGIIILINIYNIWSFAS